MIILKKMNQAEIDETEINIPVVNVDPLFNDHVTTDEINGKNGADVKK